jgi:hypothetical protein
MASILLALFSALVLMVHLELELLECEFHDLVDLLLSVKSIDECALLSHFEELDEEMLLVNAAIAHAELHEQVLELYLGRVLQGGDSHCVNPEGECLIKVLSFGQAVVQQANAHLKNY